MLNHIRVLCNHDDKLFEYICMWVGQMLKYPAIKPGVCPTFIYKGAGKGTFMLLLTKMMGSQKLFETTTPSRDIWGDFNGQMTNAILINLSELSKKETISSEGRIKALATDAALTINNKGVNQFKITSHHRFIITTNAEDPVTTKKGDKRNLIRREAKRLRVFR